MRGLVLILALALAAPVAAAEEPGIAAPDPKVPQGANLDVPQGWSVRADDPLAAAKLGKDPETAEIYFVNMTPGWHVTTGPAAIFHHPGLAARGEYRLSAKMHFFAPKGHLEGWGLFFGGSDLAGEKQSYGYFLLRDDKKFLIKKRRGNTTEVVRDWSPSDAIVAYDAASGKSATNVLVVEARAGQLHFAVNGTEVAVVPRAELPSEGLFGLRLNHHVNVHVSELAATPLAGK